MRERSPAWPVVHEPGERYRRYQAPALARPWARDLLDAADPRPGDRVLDVACGTGIVARGAARRVRPGGAVVGVDPAEPALAVASAAGPGVRWRRGDAADLPFGDAAFDVVVCHQGLQTHPDRGLALLEMRRVLVAGGRVGLSAWGPIERCPAFAALADALERRAGVHAAAAVRWLFCLSDPGDLRALLAGAGFGGIRVATAERTVRFRSVAEFLRRYVPGSPAGAATASMPAADKRAVLADVQARLAPFVDAGGLRVTMEANTAVAGREDLTGRRSGCRSTPTRPSPRPARSGSA